GLAGAMAPQALAGAGTGRASRHRVARGAWRRRAGTARARRAGRGSRCGGGGGTTCSEAGSGRAAGRGGPTGRSEEAGGRGGPRADAGQTPAAERAEGGWALRGVKDFVPWADRAERVLVPAQVGGDGVGAFLLDPRADGVRLEGQETTSGEPQFRMVLERARV